jgi:trypsin
MRTKLTLTCVLLTLTLPASASAVVGGTAVTAGGYGYAVAVGDTAGLYCAGTLIAPRAVLTAAHCITERRTALGQLRVLVGSPRIGRGAAAADGVHVFGVSSVSVHPKFSESSMRYDAALLILDRPATGTAVLPLTASSPRAGTAVTAAGWGTTREGGTAASAALRSVALAVGRTSACRRGNAGSVAYFAPSMLCAGGSGRDTCSGDSGGPLVATGSGRPVLVGITSFGDGCARAGHPGVYTRVSAIRAWVTGRASVLVAAFPVADTAEAAIATAGTPQS